VQAACARALELRRPLREVLAHDAQLRRWLGEERLAALFDPQACLGANDALIDRVLARLD
jgi:3-carboxy-cis,cis-muconate cycloisomerase